MAMDYGVQRRPRYKALIAAGVLLVLLAAGSLFAIWRNDRLGGIAEAKAWTVVGPACPIDASPPPSGDDAPYQTVAFGGVVFGRIHGAVRCHDITSDGGRGSDIYPVCQFDHPGRLTVRAPKGSASYALSPLSGATISVIHGVPNCVAGTSQEIN